MIQAVQNASAIKYLFAYAIRVKPPASEPLQSFEKEDQAIISAEAKLLNEVENTIREKAMN